MRTLTDTEKLKVALSYLGDGEFNKYARECKRLENQGQSAQFGNYLADYIKHEQADNGYLTLQEIINQGLDAFESTENVTITITEN